MSLVAALRILLVQRNWILSKYKRLSSNLEYVCCGGKLNSDFCGKTEYLNGSVLRVRQGINKAFLYLEALIKLT